MSPSQKRAATRNLQEQFCVSERRACAALGQPRSTQRYQAKPRTDDVAFAQRLRALVRQRPRFGYRRLTALYRHGDRLVACLAVNQPRALIAYRKLLAAGTSWQGVTLRRAGGELAPGEQRIGELAVAAL